MDSSKYLERKQGVDNSLQYRGARNRNEIPAGRAIGEPSQPALLCGRQESATDNNRSKRVIAFSGFPEFRSSELLVHARQRLPQTTQIIYRKSCKIISKFTSPFVARIKNADGFKPLLVLWSERFVEN
jgi:hypothetical protein